MKNETLPQNIFEIVDLIDKSKIDAYNIYSIKKTQENKIFFQQCGIINKTEYRKIKIAQLRNKTIETIYTKQDLELFLFFETERKNISIITNIT
jgi:hypothetical protein